MSQTTPPHLLNPDNRVGTLASALIGGVGPWHQVLEITSMTACQTQSVRLHSVLLHCSTSKPPNVALILPEGYQMFFRLVWVSSSPTEAGYAFDVPISTTYPSNTSPYKS